MPQIGSKTLLPPSLSLPESLTDAVLRTLPRLTLPVSTSVTSLPESPAGASHSGSLESPTTTPSGQEAAHANLSARQARKMGLLTSGICGPLSTGSSRSEALQSSLVSKLQASLQTLGSTLYALTWKPWVLPSGRSLSRLRASAHRTSATALTGWHTPIASDGSKLDATPKAIENRERSRREIGLAMEARMVDSHGWTPELCGWPTATGNDAIRHPSLSFQATPNVTLNHAALLAGWSTPTASLADKGVRSIEGGIREAMRGRTPDLAAQSSIVGPARLTGSGLLLTGLPVGMVSGGRLNPAHSRWLMGFPPEWDACAPTATRSTRGKQRVS